MLNDVKIERLCPIYPDVPEDKRDECVQKIVTIGIGELGRQMLTQLCSIPLRSFAYLALAANYGQNYWSSAAIESMLRLTLGCNAILIFGAVDRSENAQWLSEIFNIAESRGNLALAVLAEADPESFGTRFNLVGYRPSSSYQWSGGQGRQGLSYHHTISSFIAIARCLHSFPFRASFGADFVELIEATRGRIPIGFNTLTGQSKTKGLQSINTLFGEVKEHGISLEDARGAIITLDVPAHTSMKDLHELFSLIGDQFHKDCNIVLQLSTDAQENHVDGSIFHVKDC